ncbi:hypothetical protein [Thermogymnomonas acidicola]|uniref:hypothetical protein n=1 Tax=Thermogymnomonas acidicola TaxID=399579 RepID=UPI0009463651|nr:hypothetical protein [Thermogymnomonas acidicola]
MDGERLVIRVADARIPVPVAASDETWDREVTVGIRPEDLATENDVTNLGGSSEMVKFGTFEVDASNYVHGSFVVSMKVGGRRGLTSCPGCR